MRASILLLLFLSACSYRVEKEAMPEISLSSLGFPEVQAAILGPKCAQCHGWVGNYERVIENLDEILARTRSRDPNFMMPPPNAAPLSATDRANLEAWIAKGAPRVGEGEPPSTPPPAPPLPPGLSPDLTFANLRDSVLIPKCARCHSEMVNNYDSLVSDLLEIESRVRSTSFDQMPPLRAAQLTEEEKNLLLDWIEAGAPKD